MSVASSRTSSDLSNSQEPQTHLTQGTLPARSPAKQDSFPYKHPREGSAARSHPTTTYSALYRHCVRYPRQNKLTARDRSLVDPAIVSPRPLVSREGRLVFSDRQYHAQYTEARRQQLTL